MLQLLKRALLTPYYTAELFSQAKSFRDNPVIGSRFLNRLGLHAARVALGHGVTALRRLLLAPLASAAERRAFARDGFLLIEDFVAPRALAALQAEIRAMDGAGREEIRQMQQGDSATLTVLLDSDRLSRLPALKATLSDRRFLGLTSYVGARWKHPLAFLHCVKNANRDAPRDPQKTLHADTFHATMKCWLFLEDVAEEDGPFHYAPGSHRLSWARLRWEYRQSLALSAGEGDRLSGRGSFRVTEAALREMGLPAPRAFAVRAGALVIADTHGFHRRGHAARPSRRLALYGSSRSNPFNPWPGLPLRAWRALEHQVREWEYQREDRAARQAGRARATWFVAPGARLTEAVRPEVAGRATAPVSPAELVSDHGAPQSGPARGDQGGGTEPARETP